jgi:hypothetical protein
MSDTVIVALISAGSSVLVAITALILNYRGFASIDGRFVALESRLTNFENRVHADIKDLTGAINELDKRVTRIELKLGMQP